MKKFTLFALALLAVAIPAFAAADFEIKKVEVNLVTTPEYQVNPPAKQVRSKKWIAIDVTFDAKPELTDEIQINYYVYFNKRLFYGQVNHVAIMKGRDLHSVAYISPSAIAQILQGRQLNLSDVENIAVTITAPGIGAAISEKTLKPGTGKWWEALKREEGFVLNKSQTPFAPLSWDYYEALKPAPTR